MRPTHARALVAVCVLATVWTAAHDASAQTSAPPGETLRVEPLPVPDWLAWKVLYESLSFYRSQSATAVANMLYERTGLAPVDVPALFGAGEAYLLTLAGLEDEARRRIQAQYGRKPFGPPTPDAATPETGPPRLLIERGTPIFDLVRESGLYDEIEHAKHAALAAHLQRLAGAVGDGTVARLTQLVQTTVAPAITRGVLRRPSPAVAPPSAPPGASDPGSGDPQ
jgi:hypothetical protein